MSERVANLGGMEPRWAEDKQLVKADIARLNEETRNLRAKLSEEVGKLYGKIEDVKDRVGESETKICTQLAGLKVSVDKSNGHRMSPREKAAIYGALITGIFALIVAFAR